MGHEERQTSLQYHAVKMKWIEAINQKQKFQSCISSVPVGVLAWRGLLSIKEDRAARGAVTGSSSSPVSWILLASTSRGGSNVSCCPAGLWQKSVRRLSQLRQSLQRTRDLRVWWKFCLFDESTSKRWRNLNALLAQHTIYWLPSECLLRCGNRLEVQ